MDIKQGFSKQITKLNVKTATFLEENKIRTYIATLENEIREMKLKAGELGYVRWKSHTNPLKEMEAIYKQIDERYVLIREQQELIMQLNAQSKQVLGENQGSCVVCPGCGEVYVNVPKFCIKCGAKL